MTSKRPNARRKPAAKDDVDKAVRKRARELLRAALAHWNPFRVKAQCNPDQPTAEDDWTFRIERERSGRVVLDVAIREIPPHLRPLVFTLFKLLDEHVLMADLAIEVAKVELGVDVKRARGRASKPGGDYWRAMAARLRERHPALSDRAIAKYLARKDPSKFETIRKALRADPSNAKKTG